MRLCSGLVALLMVGSFLAPAHGAPVKTVAELEALFRRNPAKGFVEAQKLLDKRRAGDDLDGMMEVVRLVGPWADYCKVPGVFAPMAAAAASAAEARGRWQEAGDALCLRALCWLGAAKGTAPWTDGPRGLYIGDRCLVLRQSEQGPVG